MTTPCPRLQYANFAACGEPIAHVICHHLRGEFVQAAHTHDFAEVFWGVSGSCHHTVNGEELTLTRGRLVLLRPDDRHELRNDGHECVYSLVAIPAETYEALRTAYAQIPNLWGKSGAMPQMLQLSALQQELFDNAFQELLRDPQNRLLVDRFLLNLLYEIREARRNPYRNSPAWLQEALEALAQPQWFGMGVTAFETLTGRSREHVARVLKKTSDRTPSQAVHRARMEFAAARLLLGGDPILQIAFDCGYASVGHFYREFQKHYDQSPRAFRQTHRQLNHPHAAEG